MAAEDQFQIASIALHRGDIALGLDVLRAAVEANSNREEAMLRATDILMHFGQADVAMTMLESALSEFPTNVAILDKIVAASAGALTDPKIGAATSQLVARMPDDATLLGRLGQRLLMQGNLKDAMTALRRACSLNCNESETYVAYALACFHTNNKPEAITLLEKALELNPNNPDAEHMLASFSGANISSASLSYVENLFDRFADKFDTYLVEKLKYRTPQDVVDLLRTIRPDVDAFRNFLDVGCGTGLIAAALKSHYSIPQCVGVDISQRMLNVAESKGLYQKLMCGNAMDALYEIDTAFDLVAAIEVPIYLGDLWGLTAAVAERLSPGGLYVYSIETMEGGTYKLLPTQRFAHSIWYVENIAASFGLKPLTGLATTIRLETDNPVPGYVGVLVKSEAS